LGLDSWKKKRTGVVDDVLVTSAVSVTVSPISTDATSGLTSTTGGPAARAPAPSSAGATTSVSSSPAAAAATALRARAGELMDREAVSTARESGRRRYVAIARWSCCVRATPVESRIDPGSSSTRQDFSTAWQSRSERGVRMP
jgi:hypothetical protein